MKRRTFLQTAAAASAVALLPGKKAYPRRKLLFPQESPEPALQRLVDAAMDKGAEYADARFVRSQHQQIQARKEAIYSINDRHSEGIALRVYKDGNWGMAAVRHGEEYDPRWKAEEACDAAHIAGSIQKLPFTNDGRLTGSKRTWHGQSKRNPFEVPLKDKTDFLLSLTRPPLEKQGIVYTVANLFFTRDESVYVNSLGGSAEQSATITYPNYGITAYLQQQGRIDSRNSDIEPVQAGFEAIEAYDFKDDVLISADEVLAKQAAGTIEDGKYEVLFTSTHLWKALYDVFFPHLDPYKLFGLDGENPQWRLFTPSDIGKRTIGSELFTVQYDNSMPFALGTHGWDAGGYPAQKGTIIEGGQFLGLPGSDEFQHLGRQWRGKSMGAASWQHQPQFAMPNLVVPHTEEGKSLQEMVQGIENGFLIAGRNQSIVAADGKGYRSTGQLGWYIQNGEVKRMVRDFVYDARLEDFLANIVELGGPQTVTVGGDLFPQNNNPGWSTPFSVSMPAVKIKDVPMYSSAK
ncbi:MAG: hypothetical protein CL946_07075 [Ectothiorhodospiraceae bacterium]|nr:hypothetical protein [Ectothiorhodospiraceae bacterium]